MLVQGLPESVNRGWLYRVVVSLFADPVQYLYDMRYGGFWPLVPYFLLPVAALSIWRGRLGRGQRYGRSRWHERHWRGRGQHVCRL